MDRRHHNAASTSSLSLAEASYNNHLANRGNAPSRQRGHYVNPSISSSIAASDFGENSQFKLEEDRAPSRNGANDDGTVMSMRSLSKWSLNSSGGQTPLASNRFDLRDRERERERTITLGVLSGDERTPSPRGDFDR
jgi:hypothetical protein